MAVLTIDLSRLAGGALEIAGDIEAQDPLFSDLDFALSSAVTLRGRLRDSGPGRYYLDATLAAGVVATCRRCLADVPLAVAERVQLLFTDDRASDDPSAYVIPVGARQLELAEMVREQLILAVPEYVLCREDCRGLCARCGRDLNLEPCDCRPEVDPRWAALEALRLRGRDRKE